MEDYFSIGEISKISQIPVKTLRYYDEIDLLKPDFVDPTNNYRYYSRDQIFIISIIKELKLFEFSLSDIKELLKRDKVQRILAVFEQKKIDIEQKIQHLYRIHDRLNTRLASFHDYLNQNPSENNFFVEVKKIPERKVAFFRETAPFDLHEMALKCIKLHNHIESQGLYVKGPFMAVFHEPFDTIDLNHADVEACGEVYGNPHTQKKTKLRTIPSNLYASLVCKGGYQATQNAYAALKKWVTQSSYSINGPLILHFLVNMKLIQDEKNFVSLLEIPIK